MSEAANERSGVLMSIRGVTKAFGSNVVLKGIDHGDGKIINYVAIRRSSVLPALRHGLTSPAK